MKKLVSLLAILFFIGSVFSLPSISSVSTSAADGIYKSGTIQLTITFNEAVQVSGTPTIALNSGGSASFVSLYDSNTKLDFNYVIGGSDNTGDLNYSSTGALSGTITSQADGNAATLTLPEGASSIGGQKAIIIDTTAPTITASPPDGNDYSTASVSIDVNVTDTGSGLNSGDLTVKVDGLVRAESWSAITSGYRMQISLTDLSVGDHNYTIDANDLADNYSSLSRIFTVDLNKPTAGSITTSYTSTYTNDSTPSLTLSATDNTNGSGMTGGQMAFSCISTDFPASWHITSYSTSYTGFDITSGDYDCPSEDGNIIVYYKFRDSAGNWSDLNRSTGILFDETKPHAPTGLSADAGNGKVTLSWTEAASDETSGNDEYKIYYGVGTTYNKSVTGVDIEDTSYEITGLTNGSTYYFKMTTFDEAGNESEYSSEAAAIPESITSSIQVKRNGENVTYVKNGDVLSVSCSYSESVTSAKIGVATINPNGSEQTVEEESVSTTSLSVNYNVSNATSEKLEFKCRASGVSTTTKQVTVDNTAPNANWAGDSNSIFVGVKRITISASDNKALESVEIEINSVKYGLTAKDSSGNYYLDFNSLTIESKDYTIKGIATDAAGNKKEITMTAKVSNLLTPEQTATKLIADAEKALITANDLNKYMQEQAIKLAQELIENKTMAEQLLQNAKLKKTTDLNEAIRNANTALILLTAFNLATQAESLEIVQSNYDLNVLAEVLKGYGMSEEKTAEQLALIESTGLTRNIEFLKLKDSNKIQVKVTIEFSSDFNGDKIKIIEIIPKELLNSAKKIISSDAFTILQDDPVIEYTVSKQEGRKKICYSLGEVSAEEMQKIKDNNTLLKFEALPVLLSENEKASEVIPSKVNNNSLLILIAGILILGIIVAAGIVLIKTKDGGHGFGEKKSIVEKLTPEEKPEPKKWEANK